MRRQPDDGRDLAPNRGFPACDVWRLFCVLSVTRPAVMFAPCRRCVGQSIGWFVHRMADHAAPASTISGRCRPRRRNCRRRSRAEMLNGESGLLNGNSPAINVQRVGRSDTVPDDKGAAGNRRQLHRPGNLRFVRPRRRQTRRDPRRLGPDASPRSKHSLDTTDSVSSPNLGRTLFKM